MTDLTGSLDRLYSLPDCAAGGPLHIVTDDYNVEDHHLDFCADQLAGGSWPDEVVELAAAILAELRRLTPPQRLAALGGGEEVIQTRVSY